MTWGEMTPLYGLNCNSEKTQVNIDTESLAEICKHSIIIVHSGIALFLM